MATIEVTYIKLIFLRKNGTIQYTEAYLRPCKKFMIEFLLGTTASRVGTYESDIRIYSISNVKIT